MIFSSLLVTEARLDLGKTSIDKDVVEKVKVLVASLPGVWRFIFLVDAFKKV